jgi:hypothetical protein
MQVLSMIDMEDTAGILVEIIIIELNIFFEIKFPVNLNSILEIYPEQLQMMKTQQLMFL